MYSKTNCWRDFFIKVTYEQMKQKKNGFYPISIKHLFTVYYEGMENLTKAEESI